MKKILLTLGSLALCTSFAFATNIKTPLGLGGTVVVKDTANKCLGKKSCQKCRVIKTIMGLDLTPDQRSKMTKILTDSKKNILKVSDAFTENSFDQEKFIKIQETKKANKIKNKAQLISSLYNELNDIQKKNLKIMIDKAVSKCSSCGKSSKCTKCTKKNR